MYSILPLRLPGSRALTLPLTRPFNLDIDCVFALLPDINTTWIDYSKIGTTTTISGATLRHDGRFGPALYFDGTNDYISVSGRPAHRFSTPFSISVWAKRLGNSSDTYGTILDRANSAVNRNYQLKWEDGGTIRFVVRDVTNGADRNTGLAGFNETGTWRHIVGVYDGTNITIYVDTVASVPTAVVGAFYNGAGAIKIGKLGYASGSNYHFDGSMDEILIIGRELKLWEIKVMFNMGKPA